MNTLAELSLDHVPTFMKLLETDKYMQISHVMLLLLICEKEGMTADDYGDIVDFDKSRMSRHLIYWERLGWITRVNEGKHKHIYLSPKAKHSLHQDYSPLVTQEEEMINATSEK